jgi:hypothetical protein
MIPQRPGATLLGRRLIAAAYFLSLRHLGANSDQPRLVPASPAVEAAAEHQNDENNDDKRGGIHV